MVDWSELHFRIEIEVTEVRLLRRLAVGLSLGLQGSMYLVSERFMQFKMIEESCESTRYRLDSAPTKKRKVMWLKGEVEGRG